MTPAVQRLFMAHQLTAEDAAKDPTWITESTTLMTNNCERIQLGYELMLAWARQNNKVIVAWDKFVYGPAWDNLTPEQAAHLRDTNPELREYFVQDMPCKITENVRASAGIANGTAGRYHALAYNQAMNKHERESFDAQLNAAEAGSIVLLPHPPSKVFVRIDMDVNANAYPEAWAIDRGLDYIVVPIGKCFRATSPSADAAIKIVADPAKGIHTCTIGHHGFRLENDLASTFVKVQGHTKKKVILQLNKRPRSRLTYESLYVGLSRVGNWSDWRIAPLHPSFTLEWLSDMAPHPAYVLWRQSLDEQGLFSEARCRQQAGAMGITDKPASKPRRRVFDITGAATRKPGAARAVRAPRKPRTTVVGTTQSRKRPHPSSANTESTTREASAPAARRGRPPAPPRAPRPAPPTEAEIHAHYHDRILAALTVADAEDWNAQSLDPPRPMQPVPAQYARDFASHPTVTAYLPHLVVGVQADDVQAPAMCHSGQWSDALSTNTCPTDCQLLAIHTMLCLSAHLRTKIQRVAHNQFDGHVAEQHPDAPSRARACAIAKALLRCHAYFLAKKFSAGRLVVLEQMLLHKIVRYPATLNRQINMHGTLHMPTLLERMDKSVCSLAKQITVECTAGQACRGEGAMYLGASRTQVKLSELHTPGRQRSPDFVSDLDDLLQPTFKQLPCQVAARQAFEIAIAGPINVDEVGLRANECQEIANIAESIEPTDYPLILSVGLGAERHDVLTYDAHDLPEHYTVRHGQHGITYRLINVAAYNFSNHFNCEWFVPAADGANTLKLHYDAIEPVRVSPYNPHDLSAFTPVHALYMRV